MERKRHNQRKLIIFRALAKRPKTLEELLDDPSNEGISKETLYSHLWRLRGFGMIGSEGKFYHLTDYGRTNLTKLEYLKTKNMPLNLKKCVALKVYKSGKKWPFYKPVFKEVDTHET